jgi:hypothetical protein
MTCTLMVSFTIMLMLSTLDYKKLRKLLMISTKITRSANQRVSLSVVLAASKSMSLKKLCFWLLTKTDVDLTKRTKSTNAKCIYANFQWKREKMAIQGLMFISSKVSITMRTSALKTSLKGV